MNKTYKATVSFRSPMVVGIDVPDCSSEQEAIDKIVEMWFVGGMKEAAENHAKAEGLQIQIDSLLEAEVSDE